MAHNWTLCPQCHEWLEGATKKAADLIERLAREKAETEAAVWEADGKLSDATARAEKAEAEAEKWLRAFAAQSNKLQRVLHIPGVKDALTPKGADHE